MVFRLLQVYCQRASKWSALPYSKHQLVSKANLNKKIGTKGKNIRKALLSTEFENSFSIGSLHCRHASGQNKRKLAHIVCIKMAVNSQRRKILLFLYTNMAAMTSHANHQYNPEKPRSMIGKRFDCFVAQG